MTTRRPIAMITLLAAAVLLGACSDSDSDPDRAASFVLRAVDHEEQETQTGETFEENLSRDGKIVGHIAGHCSFEGASEDGVPCEMLITLAEGTIEVEGHLVPDVENQTTEIVGGTGAYNGANGTVSSRQVDDETNELTFTLEWERRD